MKILFSACLVVALVFVSPAWAKDPLEVAPDMYKLLYENEEVRVMQVTFKPGQKIAEHSHPNHFVYVAQPGKLKVSKPDGSSSELDLAPSQVIWIPAEAHWAENVGKTPIQLVVTELKAHSKH